MSDYDSIESLQQQGIIDSKRMATVKICLVMFFHACVSAVLMSQIFAIWLDKQVHLDSLQIGEIMGLKTLVAIFYKPLFGWLLDKSQLRIYVILSIAVLGLAAGPFFQFVYKPLLLTGSHTYFYMAGLLGGIYFGYVVIAGGAAVWSYCGRYISAHNGPLDKISAGSFMGWMVMGFCLTMLYTFNPTWGFYLASFAALCMVLTIFSLKVKPFNTLNTQATSKKKVTLKDLKYLIFNPRFYVLAFFSTTIIVAVYAQYSQVGRYTLYFWPDDKQTFALRLNAFIGIPFNICIFLLLARSSTFIKKLNSSRTLILLSICYGLALLGLGFAGYMHVHMAKGHYLPSLLVSIGAYQLLCLVNPFTNLVILSYVTASFNKKIASTAFLVGFHFICNLMGSVGNASIGGMFKVQGWSTTYFELAIFIFMCTVILFGLIQFANMHDRRRVSSHFDKDDDNNESTANFQEKKLKGATDTQHA